MKVAVAVNYGGSPSSPMHRPSAAHAGVRSARHRLASGLGILGLAVTTLGAPLAVHARMLRVLVVTETAGFHHDSIPAAEALLRDIARETGRYELIFLPDAQSMTSKHLRRARAVVFLNTSGELPTTGHRKAALLHFVRSGRGFVGTHSASDTFHGWPGYIALLGGEFQEHPFVGDGQIVIEDPTHPATRGLPTSFSIREEFYFFRSNPRCCAHVLAHLDVASFGEPATDDRPLVWCRREGRGRVFYDALGHFPETWQDDRQRSLIAGGLAWVLKLERHATCR